MHGAGRRGKPPDPEEKEQSKKRHAACGRNPADFMTAGAISMPRHSWALVAQSLHQLPSQIHNESSAFAPRIPAPPHPSGEPKGAQPDLLNERHANELTWSTGEQGLPVGLSIWNGPLSAYHKSDFDNLTRQGAQNGQII
jgi:hypothetical protein